MAILLFTYYFVPYASKGFDIIAADSLNWNTTSMYRQCINNMWYFIIGQCCDISCAPNSPSNADVSVEKIYSIMRAQNFKTVLLRLLEKCNVAWCLISLLSAERKQLHVISRRQYGKPSNDSQYGTTCCILWVLTLLTVFITAIEALYCIFGIMWASLRLIAKLWVFSTKLTWWHTYS